MSKTSTPYQFHDYREFLRAALRERGYSYRGFINKHPKLISLPMLAYTLSKGRSGLVQRPGRNLSAELLARIGKVLKLSDNEIEYLIILKWENDGEPFPGQHGTIYKQIVRRLMLKSKANPDTLVPSLEQKQELNLSSLAHEIGHLIDLLSGNQKKKVILGILDEAKAYFARQRRKPNGRLIKSVIEKVESLQGLG